jgi:hypothetical protein
MNVSLHWTAPHLLLLVLDTVLDITSAWLYQSQDVHNLLLVPDTVLDVTSGADISTSSPPSLKKAAISIFAQGDVLWSTRSHVNFSLEALRTVQLESRALDSFAD